MLGDEHPVARNRRRRELGAIGQLVLGADIWSPLITLSSRALQLFEAILAPHVGEEHRRKETAHERPYFPAYRDVCFRGGRSSSFRGLSGRQMERHGCRHKTDLEMLLMVSRGELSRS